MLCIPITGPSLREASLQIKESLKQGDILEFRLDLFETYTLESLKNLRDQVQKPLIFTLRKKTQGGSYNKSEEERLQEMLQLAALSPTYCDVEYDTPQVVIEELRKRFPALKLLISYHNFAETPSSLEDIFQQMKGRGGDLYKIACTAHSTNDSLRILSFVRSHAPLLAMGMGEKGEITRILCPVMGAPWVFSYVSPQQKTAPGQLSSTELRSLYGLSRLNKNTAIYGLIGGPQVVSSIGHVTHNRVMQRLNLNAIYVKMCIEKKDLALFFALAREMGIQGLSVTMPFKEEVISFLDALDKDAGKIGAVNTLLFNKGKWIGYNTDGKGALDAIEVKLKVQNKKILVLGAGGAARAIIYEALKRGANVAIVNRTPERARSVAQEFGAEVCHLDSLEKYAYDILINTTPDPLPVFSKVILPNTVVMDSVTLPKMTPFLQEAYRQGCTLVYGYEMFVNQAVGQFDCWFHSQLNKEHVRQLMQLVL